MAGSTRQTLFDVSAGERTVPGIWHENYWFRRHEIAYRHVGPRCCGLRVLEAGSGEGYGAHLLAEHATQVIAIDYDEVATAHHRRTYTEVPVARGNLVALPLRTASVEATVSLQTVEHLWDQPRFVAECVRVTRGGGLIAISTPNRVTFPPGNPHHPHELDLAELVGLVQEFATVTEVLGVHHGPRITAWERSHGSLVDQQLAGLADQWDPEVAAMVATVAADDFVVTNQDVETSLDLLVLAEVR